MIGVNNGAALHRAAFVGDLARLREDPASVNARIDQWDIPQGTPLDVADFQKAAAVAALFEQHGGTRAIGAKGAAAPTEPRTT